MGQPAQRLSVATGPAPPVTASYRTNLVTALLGTWFTIGLFLDAWAHNNVPRLETFFTPWHAVFYSGFAATAAWIGWTVRDALRTGRPDFPAMPTGYASSAVAVAGFAVAGGGDYVWHTVFGIEQNIDILFSPTHVALIATMLVIVTTPVRSSWADRSLPADAGLRRLVPAVLSAALATTLVLLFLQYANAIVFDSANIVGALSTVDEGFTASLVTSVAVTNLVLLLPMLTLARRWVLPPGSATVLYSAVGALSGAVHGFRNLATVLALLAAGGCVDVLARWLRPAPSRLVRYRAFGALAPLVTWTIFIATAYFAAGPVASAPEVGGGHPEAVVELYAGVPLVQAGLGVLLAVLLVPSRDS